MPIGQLTLTYPITSSFLRITLTRPPTKNKAKPLHTNFIPGQKEVQVTDQYIEHESPGR
jgi:hypothetical protein